MASQFLLPPLCFLYFVFKYHSAGYIAVGTLLLLGYYTIFFGDKLFTRSSYKSTFKSVINKINAYFLVFNPWFLFASAALALSVLGAWQYIQMNDQGDMDQSFYSTALWNMRNGSLHYEFDGKNMFGIHSQYTSFLWLPIQILFGDLGLKLFQGFGLVFSCIGMTYYLWKKSNPLINSSNRRTAGWVSLAILLSAPIASQFFYGFHPELLGAPILVVLLITYRKRNLFGFMACTALLAFTKETFTLAVGGILLLAVIEKRNWKWIFLPGILCCLQMGFYWFLIIPHFAASGNMLGSLAPTSLHQVLYNWFRPQTLVYFFQASLPFLPLIILYPKKYLVLPVPLMLFYAAFPDIAFLSMWVNYPFPTAILFSAGLLLEANGSFNHAANIEASGTKTINSKIAVTCALLSLLCYPLWREIFSVPVGNWTRSQAVDHLQTLIPPHASLIINGPFMTRLAPRKEISTWISHVKPLDYFEYAVIDTVLPFWGFTSHQRRLSVDSLLQNPNWRMEYGENGLYLFHRNK